MKLNKKGFTLVELLAIIVILAIIALITVPIITNIIADAQKGADMRSVEAYAKALESKYYLELSKNISTQFSTITVGEADYNGASVTCNPATLDETTNKISISCCKVDTRLGTYKYEGGKAVEDECTVGSTPEPAGGE